MLCWDWASAESWRLSPVVAADLVKEGQRRLLGYAFLGSISQNLQGWMYQLFECGSGDDLSLSMSIVSRPAAHWLTVLRKTTRWLPHDR
tara:strand:+ start:284 stop:550 length:267 start_codon:yes stop_codon:yes gene_type:complete